MLYSLFLPISTPQDPLREIASKFRHISSDDTNNLSALIMENIGLGKYNSIDFEKALRILLFLSKNRIIEISKDEIINNFNESSSKIDNNLDTDGVLYGYQLDFTCEDPRFNDIIEQAQSKEVVDINSEKENEIIKFLSLLNKVFDTNIEKMREVYNDDYSRLFFTYIKPEDLYKIISGIDEVNYYEFFRFLKNRKDHSYEEPEKTSFEEFKAFVTDRIDKEKGLKYFYLKGFISYT